MVVWVGKAPCAAVCAGAGGARERRKAKGERNKAETRPVGRVLSCR